MSDRLIYLDNNATTQVDEQVLEEMLPYLKGEYANPSSMYTFAKKSSNAIKEARVKVKEFVNAESEREIIFTSCGTESANTAIRGVLSMNKYKSLEKQGYNVDYIGVSSKGELELEELSNKVNGDTALVSVMYANNETGVINPIDKVSEIIKSKNKNTKLYVDAVQVAGKIPIDVQACGADMLGISGHKFHAPKGVGALYVNSKTIITPLIIGGHQEKGKRAGTENVPYIAGLGKACEIAQENLHYEATEVKRLRDKLEQGILKNIFNARLNTGVANRVPNTTNIGFEYVEGELILLHMSDLGICASSGSACTSGSLEPSHVLRAMNVPFTAIHGSIRFSLSKYTTEKDIDYVNSVMPEIIEKIVKLSPYQDELAELRRRKGV